MNRLIIFLEDQKHAKKAKFVGFIAALCALFMGISRPEIADAKAALAVIQLFWLVLLTISITSLFFDFVLYARKEERTTNEKYGLPFDFVFSISLGRC